MKRRNSSLIWSVIPLVLLSGFIAREASAGKVAVLKSADITAYNQALAGFTEEMGGIGTDKYDMEGSLTKGREIIDKIKLANPSVILTVGKKAA